MPKITDLVQSKGGGSGGHGGSLPELRIGKKGLESISLFTDVVAEASLHYEEDETIGGYFHCPPTDCPYCLTGFTKSKHYLIPVFSSSLDCVACLRVSDAREAKSLLPLLMPYFNDPEISEKVLHIHRLDKYRYDLDVTGTKQLMGANKIREFTNACGEIEKALSQVYPKPSIDELRSIPKVRRKLNVLQGRDINEGLE